MPKPGSNRGHDNESLGMVMDYCLQHVPELVAEWAAETRANMSADKRRASMEWTAYRNREIVWAKPRKDGNGADIVYTKNGLVMPKEVFDRKYEKLEEDKKE